MGWVRAVGVLSSVWPRYKKPPHSAAVGRPRCTALIAHRRVGVQRQLGGVQLRVAPAGTARRYFPAGRIRSGLKDKFRTRIPQGVQRFGVGKQKASSLATAMRQAGAHARESSAAAGAGRSVNTASCAQFSTRASASLPSAFCCKSAYLSSGFQPEVAALNSAPGEWADTPPPAVRLAFQHRLSVCTRLRSNH